jgi:hypothetical protein
MNRFIMLLVLWYTRSYRLMVLAFLVVMCGVIGGMAMLWAVPFKIYSLMMGLWAMCSSALLTWHCHPYRLGRSQALDALIKSPGLMILGIVLAIVLISLVVWVPQAILLAISLMSMIVMALLDAAGAEYPLVFMTYHVRHVGRHGIYGWLLGCILAVIVGLLGGHWVGIDSVVALCGVPLLSWWYTVTWHKAPFNTQMRTVL